MSIDMLQEKIRKLKNPSMVELMLPLAALPPRYAHDAVGYGEFCWDLLGGLKGIVPAVRLSFGAFALLGGEGLQELAQTLNAPAIWAITRCWTRRNCSARPPPR